MIRHFRSLFYLMLVVFLAACGPSGGDDGGSGGGGGGGGGGGDTIDDTIDDIIEEATTRISGSVSLSSALAGASKPGDVLMKDSAAAPKYKTGKDGDWAVANKPMIGGLLSQTPFLEVGDALSSAYVYVYNADHPEWLAPVAQDVTNSEGEYDLANYGCTDNVADGACVAVAASNGDAYVDGDPLPVGTYTMLVFKPSTFDPIAGVTTDPIVAVLPAFKAEEGTVEVAEMEAEVSDATPSVVTMFGLEKNTDGTTTWGNDSFDVPQNAAIQVSFDMAMSRGSVQNISVESNAGAVTGSWSLSADWMTATFEPDAQLAAGAHTVTIPDNVTNVYANALGYEAVGTFNATAVDQTAPSVTIDGPSGTGVSVTASIRIASDEILDINTLLLESTPSVGDLPGVLFVENDGTNNIYEFLLTESLQLETAYSLTISGIQDLAGNAAADLTGTFTTEAAADADGVDENATTETQNAQIAIAEIFAKWVSAVNERNLPKIKSVIAGSFVFEYNVQAEGGFMSEDVNRNGRLSQSEFMSLMEMATTHWEICGTTMNGFIGSYDTDGMTVLNDVINVSGTDSGDFEFTLEFTAVDGSQECSGGPEETMYATVTQNNGLWKIARMSEGFDHRGTDLVSYELLEAVLSEEADNEDGYMDVPNGSELSALPSEVDPLTFRFESATGTESYIMMLANIRDPEELGFAMVIDTDNLEAFGDSTTLKSFTVPEQQGLPQGAVDISDLFGFDNGDEDSGEKGKDWGIDNPGEVFIWEIIGLGSLTAADFTSENNPVTVIDVVRDISAVSAVKKFKNPGELKFLTYEVSIAGTPLVFDEFKYGFDAGDADSVDLTITTPNVDDAVMNGCQLFMGSDSGFQDAMLTFTDNMDGTASASLTLNLFQGHNWVDFNDGVDLYQHFQIRTTGGIPPAVEVVSVNGLDDMDADLGELTLNEWNFADAPTGTVAITASWQFDTTNTEVNDMLALLCNNSGPGHANINIHVGSHSGAFSNIDYCMEIQSDPTSFTLNAGLLTYNGSVKVYEGDNWVHMGLHGDDGSGGWFDASSNFGLFTDTGSEFVPALTINTPTTSEGDLTETGNWGQGSDWDATEVTVATNEVTITGSMADPGMPMYHHGSDGVGNHGDLTMTGNDFSLTVTLYNGWNWISLDDGNGNWYNVNIYTDNGATLPKPVITLVNDVTPVDDFGQLRSSIEVCTATIDGTAPANTTRMFVDWNGSNGMDFLWANQELLLDGGGVAGTDPDQAWTATFQVIGGQGSHNFVNVFDETNGTWAGVEIFTSDEACVFVQPEITVDSVVAHEGGGDVTLDMNEWGDVGILVVDDTVTPPEEHITPTTATTITIHGTSTVPGHNIKLNSNSCGTNNGAVATSSDTANMDGTYDWSATVNLYDYDEVAWDPMGNPPYMQWIDINDNNNWFNLNVMSDSNTLVPAPPITLTVPGNVTHNANPWDCAFSDWDGTGEGTGLQSITVSGSTTGDTQNGFGEFHSGAMWGTFEIVDGDFSFEIELFDGYNHLHMNDADGNWYDLNIMTANGNLPPQYVFIETPTHDSEDTDGTIEVTGTIDTMEFTPDHMMGHAEFFDPDTQMSTFLHFDSNLQSPNEWGDQPMNYDSMAGTFSFNFDLPTNAQDVRVEVSGCGPEGCHGHTIWVNAQFAPGEHFWKPGSASMKADEQANRRIQARRRH